MVCVGTGIECPVIKLSTAILVFTATLTGGSARAQISPPAAERSKTCRTGVPRIQAWVTGARSLRGTDGVQGLRMPTSRMQPAPNSHRSSPKDAGPDDFGASPILRTLSNGKTILVAGQKSGIIWAHDADRQGAVLWKASVATSSRALSQVNFGGSSDGGDAYFGPSCS